MTYYRTSELSAHTGSLTASAAAYELSSLSKSATGSFDVFLSHSYLDAVAVLGLKGLLEGEGLTVYVDWIVDKDLDRSRVSSATASKIRQRMRSCTSLVYATSRNASTSRWMPWELGSFDGTHGPDRVAICPIETGDGGAFVGEEYLGLYKSLEPVKSNNLRRPFAVKPSRGEAESLSSFGKARGEFVRLVNS